jgi:hypothetical protein
MKVQVSTTIASPPYEMSAFTSDTPERKTVAHRRPRDIPHRGDGVKAGTTYQVRTTPAMGVTEGTGTVLEHLPDRTVFERRLGK